MTEESYFAKRRKEQSAAQESTRNRAVTQGEFEDPFSGKTYAMDEGGKVDWKNETGQTGDPDRQAAFYNTLVNSLTGGIAGRIQRGFETDEETQARLERNAQYPGTTMAGELIGSLPLAFAGGAGMMKLLPAIGRNTATMRTLGSAFLGGTQQAATESGKRSMGAGEFLTEFGKGAGSAAVGQGLAETIGPAYQLGKRLINPTGKAVAQKGKERAAQSILDAPTPGDMTSAAARMDATEPMGDIMMEATQRMGPEQVLGDVLPDVAEDTARVVNAPATTGMTQPLKELSQSRIENADEAASAIYSRYLAPETSRGLTFKQFSDRMSALGQEYKVITSSKAAKTPSISREAMTKKVKSLFGNSRSPDMDAAMEDVLGAVQSIGEGKTRIKNMRPVDALTLKKYIDKKISAAIRAPDSALTSDTIRRLTEVKKYVNKQLGIKLGKEFRNVSSQFADAAQSRELVETGEAMFKSNKYSPSDLKVYYDALDSEVEKRMFVQGILLDVQNSARGGDITAMKSMLKNTGNKYDKLKEVVGPEKLDAFLKDADQLVLELNNAKLWEGARKSRTSVAPERTGPFSPLAYKGAMLGSFAQGSHVSGAYAASRLTDPSHAEAVREIMKLYQAKGPQAAQEALTDLMMTREVMSKRGNLVPGIMAGQLPGSANQTIMDQ